MNKSNSMNVKNIFLSLFVVMLFSGMSSCKSDFDNQEDGNHRSQALKETQMMKTVRMSFGGDCITESEEPLMRAEDGETYVALNVYSKDKSDTEADYVHYAYGLFKGLDNILIDVVTGNLYKFVATILIENKDKVKLLNGSFQDPFFLNDDFTVKESDFIRNNNKVFIYNSEDYFTQLKSGIAYVNINGDLEDDNGPLSADFIRFPRVKRFYGELPDFDPSEMSENSNGISIPMKYKSFGIKFKIDQIPEGTYVTVKDKTNYNKSELINNVYNYLLFPNDLTLGNIPEDSWDGIFSFDKFDISGEETRPFTLEFTWHKLSGKEEKFTHPINVTEKKMKVLKLKIQGDAGEISETKSGNISFTYDSENLASEEEEMIDKNF